MIKAMIIDDEENLRNGLKALIETYCPEVEIIAEADTVQSALTSIPEHNPQLIFLDIQFSDGTGFDILEKLSQSLKGKINARVIFITAHDQYAVKAFKFSALDYLLKPVDPEELKNAIGKVSDKTEVNNLQAPLELLLENIRNNAALTKRIALSTAEGIHMYNITDIIRCESLDNYTKFFIQGQKPLLVSKTLKDYEELLSGHNFERVHQSHLINLSHLKSYIKTDGGYVVMADNTQIPVSQRKREKLLKILKSI